MKKAIIGLLLILGSIFVMTATASAAGQETQMKETSIFDGTFEGTIYGDKGTRAPIMLQLNQDGRQVEGYVELGSGLFVNGGMCGSGYIPASSQHADGWVSASNPRQLKAESAFTVSGLKVTIDIVGNASTDGQQVNTQAKIDLPWLCGKDPVLTGTLYRAQ